MQQFETLPKSTIEIPTDATIKIEQVGKTDGYDGHSLRAFSYFDEQMPDIVDTVESINSVERRYKALRQESKAPTFCLNLPGYFCNSHEELWFFIR